MNFKVLFAVAALLATQSFAIIGIGGHYAPNLGSKMEGAASAPITDNGLISLSHEGFKGSMQGFGFKLWIDILPIIDIEATLNIQFGSYDAALQVTNPVDGEVTEIPLEIELGGTPFGKANPKFVAMNGDVSITYPITFIPIIRPYIGGGVTYYLNTFVLNQKFASGLIDDSMVDLISKIANGQIANMSPEEIQVQAENLANLGETMKEKIQDQALEEGLKTSIGGHVLVGLRAKLPIIPIAVYGIFKYYFGGDYPTEFKPGNMAVEVGGGFAL